METIIGRLTKDAIVDTTKTGKEVVNFSIAINDAYRDKQGKIIEKTKYVQCSYWRSAKPGEDYSKFILFVLNGAGLSANTTLLLCIM